MAVWPRWKKSKEESFHSPSSYLITPRQSLPFASQDPTTAGMNQWLTLYKCMQPCKHVLFPPTNQFHMCSRRTLHLGSLLYLSLKDTFLKKTQWLQSERCILIYWYVLKMHIWLTHVVSSIYLLTSSVIWGKHLNGRLPENGEGCPMKAKLWSVRRPFLNVLGIQPGNC